MRQQVFGVILDPAGEVESSLHLDRVFTSDESTLYNISR